MKFLLPLLAAATAVSALPSKRQDSSVCTEIRERVPWTSLTEDEKNAYIAADLCLINAPSKLNITGAVTRWDDIQWPHVVQTATVHFVGAFLPFHRYYLTAHERLIRDECGYTGRMPYWDEPKDVGDIDSADVWNYFGGDGTGSGGCVETGPFANLTLRWTQDRQAEDHCLVRRFSDRALAQAVQANQDTCFAKDNFVDAWNCLEALPHGAGHGGVGGLMSDPTLSPGDPIFYLHHSWLDKLWWEWQKLDLPNRYTDIGGSNTPSFGSFPGGGGGGSGGLGGGGPEFTDYFGDDGNTTTLNHRLYMAEIFSNITINDIMDLNGDITCTEYINV